MKIVVCDDDHVFLDKIVPAIEGICLKAGYDTTVVPLDSGEALLKYFESNKDIDIVILDILMKQINGIEAAKKIRETDERIQIFFLTSMKNYVFEGYNVRAVNYLLKPVQIGKLRRDLEKALAQAKKQDERYVIEKTDHGVFKIYAADIVYIETSQRNTCIHVGTQTVLSYKNMKRHMEELGEEDFFRIHESYIVNLKYISQVKGFEVIMRNGEALSLSKKRKKAFMEKLSQFYGNIL